MAVLPDRGGLCFLSVIKSLLLFDGQMPANENQDGIGDIKVKRR
jgi:hypothetical protein